MVSSSWPALAPRGGVVERGADGELEAVGAKLNYHGPGVALVRTRRDASGSDATLEGARWLASDVRICNGRRAELTLDAHGFSMAADADAPEDPLPADLDLYREADVVGRYYPHCERLVRRACAGAETVVAFDHNVRSEAGRAAARRLDGGNAVQARRPRRRHPPPSLRRTAAPAARRVPRRSCTAITRR